MNHLYDGEPDGRQSDETVLGAGAGGQVFRSRYRQLSEGEVARHDTIKAEAALLWDLFDGIVDGGREVALAKTKLEEAVMWAVKGLTK